MIHFKLNASLKCSLANEKPADKSPIATHKSPISFSIRPVRLAINLLISFEKRQHVVIVCVVLILLWTQNTTYSIAKMRSVQQRISHKGEKTMVSFV